MIMSDQVFEQRRFLFSVATELLRRANHAEVGEWGNVTIF